MTTQRDLSLNTFNRFWQTNNLTQEQAADILQYLEDEGITERQNGYDPNEEDVTPVGKLRAAFDAGWDACADDYSGYSPTSSKYDFDQWMKRNPL